MPGRPVAGAGQAGRRCRAGRSQVPGRPVAGAGQAGRRCRAGRLQVPGRPAAGAGQTGLRSGTQVSVIHRPRDPGY